MAQLYDIDLKIAKLSLLMAASSVLCAKEQEQIAYSLNFSKNELLNIKNIAKNN